MKPEEKERLENMKIYEMAVRCMDYSVVCGVDEAGWGPLAGDVFAAAVVLPDDFLPEGLNDSKKLSEKKREAFFDVIIANAISYGVARATAEEIDNINIRNATYLAMRRAIKMLSPAPDYVLVDGDAITELEIPHRCIVKGDSKSLSIAAASVLAKVSRDRYITELSDIYPQYNFAKHKGYGTAEHREALLQYGPCEIHRRSFLKKILGDRL